MKTIAVVVAYARRTCIHFLMSQPDEASRPSNASRTTRERDLIEGALRQAQARTSASGSVPELPPTETFPGYEVIRPLHKGGRGLGYLAIQAGSSRKVAIRVLQDGASIGPRGRARLEREAAILSEFEYPGFVRLLESGWTQAGEFFYVLDMAAGRRLEDAIEAKERPTPEEALRLVAGICDAVNAAHLRGIVHRDLKPAIIRLNAEGEPLIGDFGLAKLAWSDTGDAAAHRLILTGQHTGSLSWASPEQAAGDDSKVDVRTDVYALGVMLYQLLAGTFPYNVYASARTTLDAILNATPKPLGLSRTHHKAEIEAIVSRCLAKAPGDRYQSAGELACDIRRVLGGEAVDAMRRNRAYVLSKALRPYRAWVVVGVVGIVGLGAVVGYMGVKFRQASSALAEEAKARVEAQAMGEQVQAQRARSVENHHAAHAGLLAVMHDLGELFDDMPGGTRALDLLMHQSRAYLEQLRIEAVDDPRLLLDLALTHETIGEIRIMTQLLARGDDPDANEHYSKAESIRAALLERLPDDPHVQAGSARSSVISARFLSERGEHEAAAVEYLRAREGYERAIALLGKPATDEDAARWLAWRAEVIARRGDELIRQGGLASDPEAWTRMVNDAEHCYDEASRFFRAVIDRDPFNIVANRGLGALIDRRSEVLAEVGRAWFARSATTDETRRGEVLQNAIDRFRESGEVARQAMAELERRTGSQTPSVQHGRELLRAALHAGRSHREVAHTLELIRPGSTSDDHARALAMFERALSLARGLASGSPRSLAARRDLAECLALIGVQSQSVGRLDQALASMREAIEIRASIFAADETPRNAWDLAKALSDGAAIAARAPQREGDAELTQALEWYAQSMAHLQGLHDRGLLAGDDPLLVWTMTAFASIRAREKGSP